MTLNLNPVMSIIANVPAAVVSTVRLKIPIENKNHYRRFLIQIAASRVVRRLANFSPTSAELFS
jgi:hypothetical protein